MLDLVLITTPDWDAISGTLFGFRQAEEIISPFEVVLGQKGMTEDKIEGDLKSPAGRFTFGQRFGFAKDNTICLRENRGWVAVDDPESIYYNQIVDKSVSCDYKSCEKMEEEPLYQRGIEINYNKEPILKGKGSCIFMHIWKGPAEGTAGCTAMPLKNIEKLLNLIGEKTVLIQGPISFLLLSEYRELQDKKEWIKKASRQA